MCVYITFLCCQHGGNKLPLVSGILLATAVWISMHGLFCDKTAPTAKLLASIAAWVSFLKSKLEICSVSAVVSLFLSAANAFCSASNDVAFALFQLSQKVCPLILANSNC